MKQWNKKITTAVLAGLLTVAAATPMVWAQGGNPGSGQTRPAQSRPGRPDLPLRDVVDPALIKATVAQALGLTEAELDAAHEAGTKLEDLAATQGVTFASVQAAAKAAAIAQINQAVADGKITQTMADEMIAFVNNSDFPLPHPGQGGPGQDRPGPDDGLRDLLDHAAIKAVVAETLGITVEELEAAHDAHTRLEELAAAHGVTIEAVQAAAKAAAVTQINQAVTDGKITQAQADRFIERINNSPFPLRGPHPHRPEAPPTDPSNQGQGAVTAQDAGSVASVLFLPFAKR